MQRYILVFCLFALLPALRAQDVISFGQNYYEDNQGIIYSKETTVDLKLHTFGFAFGLNFGTIRTYYLTRYINIEFGELRHPKEFRQSFDLPITSGRISRSFVFGKQNNFFVLRGGVGAKRYLSEKASRKGVAIALSYSGGIALGLLKPYYLDLRRFPDPPAPGGQVVISSEKFSEENRSDFLDINKIIGSSGFGRGLGEIGIRPGGHAKFGIQFDWGAFDQFAKALELGVMLDAFFGKVPIMVEDPTVDNVENRFLFVNFYLSLQLGKRR